MKKCNACGSQVADNYTNCPNCGSPSLVSLNPAPVQPMPQQVPVQPMQGQMMGQQPMMGAPAQGSMPMTFAMVYMVLLGLGAVSNLISLFTNEFSVGTLISVVFAAATVYFLYIRSKVGRILAMIQGVLEAVGGGILVLLGILFMVGFGALAAEVEAFAALGAAFGIVFIVLGALLIAYGVCVFIYFKKRACMYVK